MARILVADDEEGLREFLSEALLTDGHAVTTAADGEEALSKLAGSSFDLLITDLKMPRLDGLELLRRAKSELPEMEAIVLTAHGTVETAVEAMRLGAFDYLQKPIHSPDELRLMARRALERRTLLAVREQARRSDDDHPPLSYGDPAMAPIVKAVRKVAATDATVLLLGESGTGKEVVAQTIHRTSSRAEGPFVAVNCAAFSDSLLESELFGHERGAFTGATRSRRGRIELADGGTFFLDEIGELKPELQAKLLRVLQEKRFERLGGSRSHQADVRWIAATNRDLAAMMQEGLFREDLYHRLSVFPVRLPALRDRPRDILPIAERLLERISVRLARTGLSLAPEAAAAIQKAPWRGNIRELLNVLERAAILADGSTLQAADFAFEHQVPDEDADATLAELEQQAIRDALARTGGNRKEAAEKLGIGLRTLYDKLKRYRLS